MATTNASISFSTNITGYNMNFNKTKTLHKAGSCNGLDKIQTGNATYTSTSTVVLLDQSALSVTADKAAKLYIKNLSTDTTEYFTITVNSEELGRLYAEDWMFIPWSAEDSSADIKVAPSVASSMKLEYVLLFE
jgi:hypothetical protein